MDNGGLQNCFSQIKSKWLILQLSAIHNLKEEKQNIFNKSNNLITLKLNYRNSKKKSNIMKKV